MGGPVLRRVAVFPANRASACILNCDGKVGDTGQKLAPVSPAEQAIWDRAGHVRDTLIYAYTGCVEHDDP
jgi:hypothetical protein